MFTLKQLVKTREQDCKAYVGFIDLEKTYYWIDMKALWQVLRVYGADGKILKGIKSFYGGCRESVRINGKLNK